MIQTDDTVFEVFSGIHEKIVVIILENIGKYKYSSICKNTIFIVETLLVRKTAKRFFWVALK